MGGRPKLPVEQRFWKYVDKSGECWLWTGALDHGGYGRFHDADHRAWPSHRFAYHLEHPEVVLQREIHIDHLCRTRNCVRAGHLEPVTAKENTKRGLRGDLRPNRTHCPQGHELTDENVYVHGKARHCRACGREATRRYLARKRAPV